MSALALKNIVISQFFKKNDFYFPKNRKKTIG